ncbi:MAG: helix-turn-helix transcriptional regulator [bacterium]|nr:helix-turn-helix transcriptional regulator [bacterium]
MKEKLNTEIMKNIRRLAGPITEEDLRYVDSFITRRVAIFIPVAGACFYAITPEHSHPGYMFIQAFNNETKVKIGTRIERAIPERIMALSPGIPHQELPADLPPRYAAIFIEKAFFEEQLNRYFPNRDIRLNGENYPVSPRVLPLVREFGGEYENNLPGSEQLLEAISLELCHAIIRSIFEFTAQTSSISTSMEINRSLEYIHTHLGHKIAVEDMASRANLSVSHFTRIFKQETTATPIEYLKQARLEAAKKMLQAADRTITEIAYECGFNSSAYLSSSFAEKYEVSPSEYRRLYKKA